mmetsp:Transcript_8350/g.7894  ORF Transcript_8350/g.7894 Transcript_8350/m.7894 type:complete len:205 (-) Transcript_8350:1308-1922(-)
MKGLRPALIPAAMHIAAERHPSIEPITNNFPTTGGAGIPARCIPRGINDNSSPFCETAPSFDKQETAASMESLFGGSRSVLKKFPFPRSTPRKSSDKRVCSNAHLLISGSPWAGSFDNVALEISLKQVPDRTRPARPRRCFKLSFEANFSTSMGIRFEGSYELCFSRQVSITFVQSGIVIEVSATFVARMTLVQFPTTLEKTRC